MILMAGMNPSLSRRERSIYKRLFNAQVNKRVWIMSKHKRVIVLPKKISYVFIGFLDLIKSIIEHNKNLIIN